MRTSLFEALINISLGIAWVIALGGAFLVFSHFYNFGFLFALISGFFGFIPGLFLVVTLEFMLNFIEMKKNSVKQTKILEEIYKQFKSENNG